MGAGDLERFERELRDTARNMRRMPADLRRELGARVQPEVAAPLAQKIAGAMTGGPWDARLAGAVKARKLADPTIVIGGRRPIVSGGAGGRQLVYGATWGGGKRVASVTRRLPSGGTITYDAHVTAQFKGKENDNIFPTLRRESGWVLDQFARIVDDVLSEGITRNG